MTRPAILYPDAVKVVADYLTIELAGSGRPEASGVDDVLTREPDPFNAPVVTVRLVGGVDDGYVTDRPRIDIIVWHTDEGLAQDLVNLCRAYLLAIPGVHNGVIVNTVSTFAGPVSVWDEDRNLPRYLLTVEVGVRGTAI